MKCLRFIWGGGLFDMFIRDGDGVITCFVTLGCYKVVSKRLSRSNFLAAFT